MLVLVLAALAAAACVPVETGTPMPPRDPFSQPSQRVTAAGQHPLTFTRPDRGGDALRYLLFLPKGFDAPLRKWPVILYLHGQSLCGDDPKLLLRYGLPKRLERDAGFPFIVVSPQLRAGERWTDFDALTALLDLVLRTYPADPERVYVTGFSMGGGGTWRLANAHPKRFAAAAPLAGRGEPDGVRGLVELPIWAFHGDADTAEPLASSQSMVDAVNAAGGRARLTVLPGRGHDIADVHFGRELFLWMLRHRVLADGTRREEDPVPVPDIADLGGRSSAEGTSNPASSGPEDQ